MIDRWYLLILGTKNRQKNYIAMTKSRSGTVSLKPQADALTG